MCCAITILVGCAGREPMPAQLGRDVGRGNYDQPREHLQQRVDEHGELWRSRLDRREILDRYRLGVVALAAGDVQEAERPLRETFELLASHGINRRKQLAATIINEDQKIWKGEPFEQAMAFYYVGLVYAMMDSWDNTRAAAHNALYHLEDYDPLSRRIDPDTLERRAHQLELGRTPPPVSPPQTGFVPVRTDFVLGYLVNAIANQQLGRDDEARDNFREAARLDGRLEPLIEAFRGGDYNTVMVVDFGLGPAKRGAGPDGAIVRFVPRTPSTGAPLHIENLSYPPVVDLNALAEDHKWNRYEALRVTKSNLGTGMMVGGVATAASSNDEIAQLVGLGLVVGGALLKAGAHADLRYCDVLPQRTYLIPMKIEQSRTVTVRVEGQSLSRRSDPPPHRGTQLIYVRFPSG
jgi:tetratricopeptide (TPR) repeat protein